jgi:hypothetical protein
MSNGRRVAFKILAGVFAAASWGALFGVALVIAWFDNADGGIHRVHDMGFGALYGVILTVGLVAQMWRAETRISAFYQILHVAIASAIAGLIVFDGFVFLGLFIAVGYVILLLLHPNRSEVLRPKREGFSVPLMLLAVLGAVPLIWFTITMARYQRNGFPFDLHVQQAHWTVMAAMAIGIVLVGSVSAFKFRGWAISAWSAGVAVFLYGLISTLYPNRAGAEGTGWGLVAMAGGVLFVAVAEWERRRPLPAGSS